jgi:hypothetical protein
MCRPVRWPTCGRTAGPAVVNPLTKSCVHRAQRMLSRAQRTQPKMAGCGVSSRRSWLCPAIRAAAVPNRPMDRSPPWPANLDQC